MRHMKRTIRLRRRDGVTQRYHVGRKRKTHRVHLPEDWGEENYVGVTEHKDAPELIEGILGEDREEFEDNPFMYGLARGRIIV